MQKEFISVITVAFLLLGLTTTGFAAKDKRCTVESIADDGKISMTCSDTDAFKAGDTIKLSPSVKGMKCTITSIAEDGKVSMTCEKAEKLKAGDAIKLRPPKKKASEAMPDGGC